MNNKFQVLIRLLAIVMLAFFVGITLQWFDKQQLVELIRKLIVNPLWLLFMFTTYLLSFLLKAEAWRRYVDREQPLSIFLYGLFYSLLVNHLLPIKAGDIVRTGVLMKGAGKPWDEALHSVVAMRILDLLFLGTFAGVGLLWLGLKASWLWGWIFITGILIIIIGYKVSGIKRIPFLQKHFVHLNQTLISRNGRIILILVAASWILEAGILYGMIMLLEINLNVISLVWVNSLTIAGQVLHITPGGIGTYESTLSGALVLLGIGWKQAYAAAIFAHGFKFMFAYVMGLYTIIRMPINRIEYRQWFKRKKEIN